MIDRSVTDWYQDAVVYQVHVKSFFDSDNDGIGDFAGLAEKLDYIRDLGVTAIWLMPFYPSPLRDDGYDIADYRGIHEAYGDMRGFRNFVREAHRRNLRVITELVINHTSDQHPWFEKARKAKPGTAARDFYVWSDNDKRYADARIIFLDTEPSNWSWDQTAKAYYWHRFYSHQPDLNFDNPRVLKEVIATMRFWLDTGVDGLRLDAIPYLVERDGTDCENLPETHAVIRRIRAALDAAYPDRMLLAEANQWPEQAARYFGAGDECHMAFHFPLMPRMYMAIAQEDRHPITDIMRQTPEIPERAQWAIFLRNHDELTLEMVTNKERDYLWSYYAGERRARINLGIRRRLAPLLENDRRKIELMNSLLLSMPGTPVLYYGDEIGMGDNIYLGDRHAVRTPMQWTPDRNGGFSRCDPARLFLPAIQDPVYGYDAVNVEAQLGSPASLLNWMRRMIAVRQNQKALGRGTLRFLYPENRKVLVYLRELGEARILCIANCSRAPQAVALDLSEMKGLTPVELTGGTAFPPVGEAPYTLSLPGYGFYWFSLTAHPLDVIRPGPQPAAQPELFTLVMADRIGSLLEGRERLAFERTMAPRFLAMQRWFAGRGRRIGSVRIADMATLADRAGRDRFLAPILSVALDGEETQTYFLPLSIEEDRDDAAQLVHAVARVRQGARTGLLCGASGSAEFALTMIADMLAGTVVVTESGGRLVFATTPAFPGLPDIPVEQIRRTSYEQSHSSIQLADKLIIKLYRRVSSGIHPEFEVRNFLSKVGFAQIPPVYGTLEHRAADGTPTALAMLQPFVRNQGDAWAFSIDFIKREIDTLTLVGAAGPETPAAAFEPYRRFAATLGRRTAELHLAFATPTDDPAFAAEPLADSDLEALGHEARRLAESAFAALARRHEDGDGDTAIAALLARRKEAVDLLDRPPPALAGAIKTRIHSDLHLGQILVAEEDIVILDFEGEPTLPAEERRRKSLPLRDVAAMLRSFSYAAEAAVRDLGHRFPEAVTAAKAAVLTWQRLAETSFLAGYREVAEGTPVWIADDTERQRLLTFLLLAKGFYEIDYEAKYRPEWIATPVHGVLALLDGENGG